MNIGSKNKRVVVQSPTLTPDGMGGYSTVFCDVATVYASIWPVNATEIIANNSSSMVASHRIRMRYRSDIKANWRLKHEHKYYDIVSIIDKNMSHTSLELLCKVI